MIAHIVMSTGMTWDQAQDQLDLPALGALTRYWDSNPPLHLMVAAYLGIEPKSAGSTTKKNDEQTLAELMAAFPGV